MKPVIYIASDSTVQSYAPELFPQTGWGQVLISCFCNSSNSVRISHPDSTAFPHVIRYDIDTIAIDNRAFAGRSARSFWEEGRFAEIVSCLNPGDYVFLQFAHNDANAAKPERYIPVAEYPQWLHRYVSAIKEKHAIPVLITAIAMRTFLDDGTLPVSFPQYRSAMLQYAAQNDVICLDLAEATRAYCEAIGPEGTKKIFMCLNKGEYPGGPYCDGKEDNAHLQYEGAVAFAKLLADLIRSCPALNDLAALLV